MIGELWNESLEERVDDDLDDDLDPLDDELETDDDFDTWSTLSRLVPAVTEAGE